ncbi:hypothetical protein [Sphingopyxis sp. DBS4]|uniref:hypothetical protein n=1 Tax=Sphingopyxis sp. DBS4 TaxID=2968500 RepID=UPI00214AECDC|nr:hypothetical protein [Sphingopyxis sp. DBS4]
MPRISIVFAAPLLLASCGDAVLLANQTKTVAAPREAVFAKMFGDDGAFAGLPLVTNGGSDRLYELVVEKSDPMWAQIAPKQRPDAYKVKIAVQMDIPREAHMIYSVDDGALATGLKFNFEELAPDRTRVTFTIDELTGDDTDGLAVNTGKLRGIARDALRKLDAFDAAKDAV